MKSEALDEEWRKLDRNLGYYFSKILGRPLCPPEHVYFSLTNRCNLKCKMCSVSTPESAVQGELPFDECKDIIDQIADLKIEHIIFSGGEPIIRADIFELIEHAVSRKIKMITLISNGSLIGSEVARRLVDSGLTHITLSLDGLEQTHDFIRGKGVFKRALRTIDVINQAKGNRKFPTVGINFTIMNCNVEDMVPMVELARSKKCSTLVFQPMLADNTEMHTHRKNELWVSERKMATLKSAIHKLLELKRTLTDLSIHVNEKILELIPDYFEGTLSGKRIKCFEAFVRIVIIPDGNLWTCRGFYGDLKKGSLKKHWFSRRAKNIRREIDHCKTHCLQSCVHLAELADIYPEVDKFLALIAHGEDKEEYSLKLIGSLKRYKQFLEKKRRAEFFTNALRRDAKSSRENLNKEISKIAESIGRLGQEDKK